MNPLIIKTENLSFTYESEAQPSLRNLNLEIAQNSFVAIHGWRELTDTPALEFMSRLPSLGVHTAIYTDIARDGMLSGPNLAAYTALHQIPGLNIIASGGVTSEADITALTTLGVHGAIIGKALYAGHITLERALALAGGTTP